MHTRIEKVEVGEGMGNGVHLAAEFLRAGELVAFPTETVYGLGADARRGDAVAKIFEAKGRPAGNPVIVHVADVAEAKKCVEGWHVLADHLAEKFWPGPLTMIMRRGKEITPLVSAGRETVAVRCPAHPVAQALLRAVGGPIAAPSANRSGFTSPTTAGHVYAELAGRVPLILDGGKEACRVGLESTVLDISGDVPTVLRPGAITVEMLTVAIGEVRVAVETVRMEDSAASPGQHSRHYAPRTAAYRFGKAEWAAAQKWADKQGAVALLTWSDAIALGAPHETLRLPEEEAGYAREFYAALRQADEKKLAAILILSPPHDGGMWRAVIDRLQRATQVLPKGAA